VGDRQTEDSVERSTPPVAPVEAEDIFVEITLDIPLINQLARYA
jgi:hypothetical protein